MREVLLTKKVSVEKRGKKFILKKDPSPGMQIKYLAKHPVSGLLFLLLKDERSYSVFCGTESAGLRICEITKCNYFGDCLTIAFKQDGIRGAVSDIHPTRSDVQHKHPMFDDYTVDSIFPSDRQTRLEVLPIRIGNG